VVNGLDPMIPNGLDDEDGDNLNNLGEYLADTDPFDPDTDNDAMTDDFEAAYGCMMAHTVDNALDYDFDGLSNQTEFVQSKNPCAMDSLPGSSCSSALSATNGDTIGLDFTCSDPWATITLKVSFDGGPYLNAGVYANGASGRMVFTFNQGEGVYRFHSIAVLSFVLIEDPPVSPSYDAEVAYDQTVPNSFASQAPTMTACTPLGLVALIRKADLTTLTMPSAPPPA